VKLDLLNSAFYIIYRLKFKTINKNLKYYYLIGLLDNKDASKLLLYQIGKEIYWKNSDNIQYGYSKLLSNELLMKNKQTKIISSLNVIPIAKNIQDLFNIT